MFGRRVRLGWFRTIFSLIYEICISFFFAVLLYIIVVPLTIPSGGTILHGLISTTVGLILTLILIVRHKNDQYFLGLAPTSMFAYGGAVLLYGPGIIPAITVWVGVLLLIISIVRAIHYILVLPPSLVYGFLGGLGIFMGRKFIERYVWGPIRMVFTIPGSVQGIIIHCSVFIVSLFILFLAKKYFPRILGFVFIFCLFLFMHLIPWSLDSLSTIGSFLPSITIETLTQHRLVSWKSAIGLMTGTMRINAFLVACIITLTSLFESSVLHQYLIEKKNTDELSYVLFLSGLGTLVSGFLGGLVVSPIFARSNQFHTLKNSGSSSRLIGFISVFFLFILFSQGIGLLHSFPIVLIASMIIVGSYDLVRKVPLMRLYRLDKIIFIKIIILITMMVFFNPLLVFFAGLIMEMIHILHQQFHRPRYVTIFRKKKFFRKLRLDQRKDYHAQPSDIVILKGVGTLSYLHVSRFEEQLRTMPYIKYLIISFGSSTITDINMYNFCDLLCQWRKKSQSTIILSGLFSDDQRLLSQFICVGSNSEALDYIWARSS
ncbi:MAG: SulP family inorganic anion transporter [Candidatus Absconditabacterales bacterium]|nr:SulP family inorganic anion transporter [Candidatus Absconditabacterales bacterium]